MRGRFGLKATTMHIFCWCAPLILALLPLSTTTYGRDDDSDDAGFWCSIRGNSEDSLAWVAATLYAPLFTCLTIMGFHSLFIFLKYKDVDLQVQNPEVHHVVKMLWLYPFSMIICWGPNFIVSLLLNFGAIPTNSYTNIVFSIVSIMVPQNGTLSTIIFFVKSQEARHRWRKALHWERRDAITPLDYATDDLYRPEVSEFARRSGDSFSGAGDGAGAEGSAGGEGGGRWSSYTDSGGVRRGGGMSPPAARAAGSGKAADGAGGRESRSSLGSSDSGLSKWWAFPPALAFASSFTYPLRPSHLYPLPTRLYPLPPSFTPSNTPHPPSPPPHPSPTVQCHNPNVDMQMCDST